MLPSPGPYQEIKEGLLALPQVDLKSKNYFIPGIYCREITIPPGVMVAGAKHKGENLTIVSAGKILIWSEVGKSQVIEAPYTFVSKPGVQRVGLALTTTVWTDIYHTDKTDIIEIENELFENPEELMTRRTDVIWGQPAPLLQRGTPDTLPSCSS